MYCVVGVEVIVCCSHTVSAAHIWTVSLQDCTDEPDLCQKQQRPCHIDLSRVHPHVHGIFHSYVFVLSVYLSVEWTVVSLGFVKTDRMCKLNHFTVAWHDNTVITLCWLQDLP